MDPSPPSLGRALAGSAEWVQMFVPGHDSNAVGGLGTRTSTSADIVGDSVSNDPFGSCLERECCCFEDLEAANVESNDLVGDWLRLQAQSHGTTA